jgi:hypothetical protein
MIAAWWYDLSFTVRKTVFIAAMVTVVVLVMYFRFRKRN